MLVYTRLLLLFTCLLLHLQIVIPSPILTIDPIFLIQESSQTPNVSYPFSTTLGNSTSTLGSFLPYHYKIPNTVLTLHYASTSWLTYKAKLATILASSQKIIEERIKLNGPEGKLVTDSDGQQSFWNSVQNGFDVKVANIKPHELTWGDMQGLFKGLRQQCWLQTCRFEVEVGKGVRVAKGKVYKT